MSAESTFNESEILAKLENYCVYQERCKADVIQKLYRLKVPVEFHNNIIEQLILSDFLNEKRFVDAFCRGKFNQKSWGKIKIRATLRAKDIEGRIVDIGINKIDDTEYINRINKLIDAKINSLSRVYDKWEKSRKVIAYLTQKGYELEIILNCIKNKL